MIRMLLLLACCQVQVACKSRNSESDVEAIFGTDDRVEIPKSYSFIGRFGQGCTAFSISPRLIMTAAHCTFSDVDLTWTTNGSGEKFMTTLVARGMFQSNSGVNGQLYGAEIQNDWAILKLDRPTKKWKRLGANIKKGDRVAVVGYSYDLREATGHNNCQIKELNQNVISHDCDMQGGASGGPIMKIDGDDWLVVGIQSSEHCESSDCRNEAWNIRNSNRGCYLSPEILDQVREVQKIYEY